MELIEELFARATSFIPTVVTLILVVCVIILVRFILNRRSAVAGHQFRIQLTMLLLSFAGLLVVILTLPISENKIGQLLSLIGILLSAAIALSATTFVGNIMAGLMQRAVQAYRPGDFIRVGEHFGRISEQGLFHVEIQTEDRDLTTMPNLYLVTNPVKVIRSSGTIISADVSLGYDVPRSRIEELLIEAANAAELKEPFVYIMSLGDFSVTYRINGLLPEVKHTLSTRSRLREMMLDKLHEGGIEIVSPTFMNQRVWPAEKQFRPRSSGQSTESNGMKEKPKPEDLVFDKAEEAESLEKLRERHKNLGEQLKALKEQLGEVENIAERDRIEGQREALETRREWLAEYIKRRENDK